VSTEPIEVGPSDSGSAESVRSVGGANVSGERDIPSVNAQRSLQSRVNSLLALVVMVLIGGGFLYFYYSNLSHHQADAKAKVVAERTSKSAGEMKLPPLGAVDGPAAASTDSTVAPDQGPTALGDMLGTPPPLRSSDLGVSAKAAGAAVGPDGQPIKTAAQLMTERQLTPSVFLRASEGAPVGSLNASGTPILSERGSAPSVTGMPGGERGQIETYMTPTVTTSTRAQVLASQRFIIPKGNFLDCTLETAVNSDLPGMTTCVTAFDIFGADGKVVLLERGSKLVGETRGQVAQGMSRLFILWSQVRTPTGVVVQLDSPGTDELGRAGVTGNVNSHFWARFGAALLVSVIDGVIQGVVTREEGSGSTLVLNPQGGQQVTDDILRNTINIPPTITVNQGSRVQVIVARDVDFRSVYELKVAATR
jgi:type IV secretion system protein VirB10